MKTVFVSGHKHVSDDEFGAHYVPKLDALLAEGTTFLVGDADGFDAKVQALLHDSGAKVIVYHMKDGARNNVGNFPCQGGFETPETRDTAMTQASTEDLAWVRPGRAQSGVGANVKRRAGPTAVESEEEEDDGADVDEDDSEENEQEDEDADDVED